MSIADLIAQMRAAGASLDVIEIAVRSLETAMESERAKDAERRAKQAARVRKHRETHRKGVTVTLPSRDGNFPPPPSLNGPPPSPAPQPPPLNPSPHPGSDPDGSAGCAGPAGSDGTEQARSNRRDLLTIGVDLISANTGRSRRSARALIGHWLGIARDEAVVVLEVIEDADGRELADFSTWVEFRLRKRRDELDRPPPNGPRGGGSRPPDRPTGFAGRLIRQHAESLTGAYDVEPPSIDANDPSAEPHRGEGLGVSWAAGGASRPSDALLRATGQGAHDSRASSALRRRRAAGG